MESFLDLVNKRYSVRAYTDKPVEREKLARCLEAARLAPSACNSQPWKFLVVDDPAMKDRLCGAIFSGAYATNKFVKKAPVLVFLISDKGSIVARLGGFLRDIRYYLVDIGIAGEHFALQAAEEGLGTCWLGWFNEKQAKRLLGLPDRVRIDVVISAGYPAGNPRQKIRKPTEEMSSYYKPTA